MAITYTEADLAAAKAALLTGAGEVQIGDRRIKYRTQAELLQLINLIQTAISGSGGENPNTIQASFSKGAD